MVPMVVLSLGAGLAPIRKYLRQRLVAFDRVLAMNTPEQQARDLLTRLGYPRAETLSSGDVLELANLIADRDARGRLFRLEFACGCTIELDPVDGTICGSARDHEPCSLRGLKATASAADSSRKR